MPRTIQRFEVSLKAFIVEEGRVLLVQEADTGFWELPGGRIDVGEEWLAHADILAREIAEELGADFRVEAGPQAVTWVRQRPVDGAYQFLVARICRPLGGAPRLSEEHAQLRWTTPADWPALTFPPQSHYRDALVRLWGMAMSSRTP
jgi:8-oxo-dGTP pyrophosphatase MutT (NUDIX family)